MRGSSLLLLLLFGACTQAPPLAWDGEHHPVPAAPALVSSLGTPTLIREGRLGLAACLRRALVAHPALRAAEARARAAEEERPQAAALPDPRLGFAWFVESIQTRTGPQEFTLGLSQNVPWPGKLARRVRVAEVGERIAWWKLRIAERDVLLDVHRLYHELAYLHGAVALGERIVADLERLGAEALGPRKEPGPRMPALARAESELQRARLDRLTLSELREVTEERLRAALALPEDIPLAPPVEVAVPALDLDARKLYQVALETNHDLRLADLRVEASRARESLARQAFYPDFSVGARYLSTGLRTDASPNGNGDDPWLLEVGMTLPLQVGGKQAGVAQARALRRGAALDREAAVQGLRGRVWQGWWKVRNLERSWRLYRDTLVPQAEASARAAVSLHDAGETSLDDLVEARTTWHQHAMAALRARSDLLIALAELEALCGVPFEPVNRGGPPR